MSNFSDVQELMPRVSVTGSLNSATYGASSSIQNSAIPSVQYVGDWKTLHVDLFISFPIYVTIYVNWRATPTGSIIMRNELIVPPNVGIAPYNSPIPQTLSFPIVAPYAEVYPAMFDLTGIPGTTVFTMGMRVSNRENLPYTVQPPGFSPYITAASVLVGGSASMDVYPNFCHVGEAHVYGLVSLSAGVQVRFQVDPLGFNATPNDTLPLLSQDYAASTQFEFRVPVETGAIRLRITNLTAVAFIGQLRGTAFPNQPS